MPLPDVARARPQRQRDRGDPFLSCSRERLSRGIAVSNRPQNQAAATEPAEFVAEPYATLELGLRCTKDLAANSGVLQPSDGRRHIFPLAGC